LISAALVAANIIDGDGGRISQISSTCAVTPVHDRMPVILDPNAYDLWLDPGMLNVAAISELLKPFDAGLMKSYPVSTRINHVANDEEECSRPVELAEIQNRLFA
jgi:putative SOS response-associated peptidase YedK